MNSPKLRFPGFSEEWEVKEFYDLLQDVLDFRGRTPLKLGMEWGGTIPSLSALNVKMGYIDLTIDPHMGSNELYKKWMVKGDLEKGDIVFTMEAPLGNVAQIPDDNKYILSQRVVALKTKKNCSRDFLYVFMSGPKFQMRIDELATGSTAKGINQRSLQKVHVSLPVSIDEQEKIAGFLTIVDERIATIDKKVELLKQYKKGVMQKIFTQQIRFKDENNKPYPDWQHTTLGEIADVRDGTHESPVYVNEGYPLVTSKNLLRSGTIDLGNASLVSKTDFDNINKRSGVDVGDILFGMIGTIGNPARVQRNGFAIKNVALIKENGLLSNAFLIHYLRSSFIAKQFHTDNAGGTQKFIALGVIRKIKIAVPPKYEQQKIAEFLSVMDDKIKVEEAKLVAVKSFKKSLLQRMLV